MIDSMAQNLERLLSFNPLPAFQAAKSLDQLFFEFAERGDRDPLKQNLFFQQPQALSQHFARGLKITTLHLGEVASN